MSSLSNNTKTVITVAACAVTLGAALSTYIFKDHVFNKKEVNDVNQLVDEINADEGEAGPDEIAIYFGSQTGTAESFAHEIEKMLTDKGIVCSVIDLEDFNPELFVQHKTVILVVATYGEGDPTDTAIEFNRWVTSKKTMEDLSHMRYAVMGLGNRQYMNYNEMARRSDKHLSRLGATPFCERGEGNDEGDLENDFHTWLNGPFATAIADRAYAPRVRNNGRSSACSTGRAANQSQQQVALLATPSSLPVPVRRAPLQAVFATSEAECFAKLPPVAQSLTAAKVAANMATSGRSANPGSDIAARGYFSAVPATVKDLYELRPQASYKSGMSTAHMELSLPEGTTYTTAHNLDIFPQNPSVIVDSWIKRLSFDGMKDLWVSFKARDATEDNKKRPFPSPVRVRDAFALYCDLITIPPKSVLKDLAEALTDATEKKNLLKLLSDEGAEVYKLAIKDQGVSFGEFVDMCMTSLRISLGDFLQICPRQRARAYTISSSHLVQSTVVSVTVSRCVEERESITKAFSLLSENGYTLTKEIPSSLENNKHCFGELENAHRCTTGLISTQMTHPEDKGCFSIGSTVHVLTKSSLFKLPDDPTIPVIMVGAGTGIAPFRAFVQEFNWQHKDPNNRRARTGETALFFGCQHPERDYIFKNEIDEAVQTRALSHFFPAFSRVNPNAKFYVQDAILKEAKTVGRMLKDGAHIYVCGATQMGAAVEEAIAKVAEQEGITKNGKEFVDKMKTVDKTFMLELWA